eukprot:216835-Karenia_brevis.AAC.1
MAECSHQMSSITSNMEKNRKEQNDNFGDMRKLILALSKSNGSKGPAPGDNGGEPTDEIDAAMKEMEAEEMVSEAMHKNFLRAMSLNETTPTVKAAFVKQADGGMSKSLWMQKVFPLKRMSTWRNLLTDIGIDESKTENMRTRDDFFKVALDYLTPDFCLP